MHVDPVIRQELAIFGAIQAAIGTIAQHNRDTPPELKNAETNADFMVKITSGVILKKEDGTTVHISKTQVCSSIPLMETHVTITVT